MSTGSAHLRRERKEALLRDALLVDAFRVLVVAVLLVHDRLRQIEQGVLRSDSARLHEGEGILRILKIQGTDVGDPDVKEAHVLEVERTRVGKFMSWELHCQESGVFLMSHGRFSPFCQ